MQEPIVVQIVELRFCNLVKIQQVQLLDVDLQLLMLKH